MQKVDDCYRKEMIRTYGTVIARLRRNCCSLFEIEFNRIAFFVDGLPDFIDSCGLKFHRLVADGARRKFRFESKI